MKLKKIKNHRGNWIQGDENISTKAAIRHFKKLFNLRPTKENRRILECIPTVVIQADNEFLTSIPGEMEVRETIPNISFTVCNCC